MSIIRSMEIRRWNKEEMEKKVIENIKANMTDRMIDGFINGTSPCYSEIDYTLEELWGQPEDPIEQIAQYNTSSVN